MNTFYINERAQQTIINSLLLRLEKLNDAERLLCQLDIEISEISKHIILTKSVLDVFTEKEEE